MQAFFSVLPAQAGVILSLTHLVVSKIGTPRTSGGDPFELV